MTVDLDFMEENEKFFYKELKQSIFFCWSEIPERTLQFIDYIFGKLNFLWTKSLGITFLTK